MEVVGSSHAPSVHAGCSEVPGGEAWSHSCLKSPHQPQHGEGLRRDKSGVAAILFQGITLTVLTFTPSWRAGSPCPGLELVAAVREHPHALQTMGWGGN